MPELKTQITTINAAVFLDKIESDIVKRDCFALIRLMEELTCEPATMWGPAIIGFGKHHYKYESGHEMDICLTGFSPRKGKLSLYVLAGFDGQEKLLSKLGKHKAGKGCLYVKKLADIDLDVLREIILKSVGFLKEK